MPAQLHELEETHERLALFGERVRPERGVLLAIVDPAPQVVEVPLAAVASV